MKCVASAAGAAVLIYAAGGALKYATGQAIVAGAALPALTVLAVALLAGAAIFQLTA